MKNGIRNNSYYLSMLLQLIQIFVVRKKQSDSNTLLEYMIQIQEYKLKLKITLITMLKWYTFF